MKKESSGSNEPALPVPKFITTLNCQGKRKEKMEFIL